MKRPMCVIGLSLTLTTLAAFFFSPGKALALSAAAAATGLLLAFLGKRGPRVACVVCFSAAVAFAGYTLFHMRSIAPFQRAAGETVAARGLVTEAGQNARVIHYTLAATFPGRDDLPDTTVALRAFGEMDYVAGDVIRCEIKLDDTVAAPGDYGFSRGGFVSGQLVGESRRMVGGYPVRRRLLALGARMQRNVNHLLPGDTADLVNAMILGRRDNLNDDIHSAVSRAGTAHLLTVSGLHLSILTGALLGVLEGLRLPRRAASLAALGAALLFSALVGLSASILRSLLMTAITLLARAGPRRSDSLSSLGFAAGVISLTRPTWLLGLGFWFSACSTLGILVLGAPLSDRWVNRLGGAGAPGAGRLHGLFVRTVVGAGGISVGACLFTLPLQILSSGWISLVAPVANVLISPFVAPLIAGGILCALVGGGALPLRVIAWGTDLCAGMVVAVSRALAGLPLATLSVDEGWMVLWLIFAAGVAAVLVICRANKRLAAFACALAVLTFGAGSLSRAAMDRDVVELCTIQGSGAAVLLRGGEAVILGTPAKGEAGRLLRYLEYREVTHIRAVVAADCGEQISGGLLRLGERYPVDCVVGPNDAYILGQLAVAMGDVPVYSGGYATLDVLGGVTITLQLPRGEILVRTPGEFALKSGQTSAEYAIIGNSAPHHIGLFLDGMVLEGARGYEPTPVGTLLYGETRFRLRLR